MGSGSSNRRRESTVNEMSRRKRMLVMAVIGNDAKKTRCIAQENNQLLGILYKDNCTVLHIASQESNKDVIDALLDCGADVTKLDRSGWTSMHTACLFGNMQAIDTMVRHDRQLASIPSRFGCHPICCAIKTAREKVIEYYLKNKLVGVMEDVDPSGRTVLHIACQTNNRNIVDLILNYGAVIEQMDKDGQTAMHIACFHGNVNAIDAIVKRNIRWANIRGRSGTHPIHLAIQQSKERVVEYFLEKKLVNLFDDIDMCGGTLLHSTLYCNEQMYNVLYRYGARKIHWEGSLAPKNGAGLTPMELVEYHCGRDQADKMRYLLNDQEYLLDGKLTLIMQTLLLGCTSRCGANTPFRRFSSDKHIILRIVWMLRSLT
jgi:ankyrin repeat protein